MIKFRPFTKTTWFGYAGATPFASAAFKGDAEMGEGDLDPLLGILRVDGVESDAVLDACCAQIYDDDSGQSYWSCPMPLAARACALLEPEMTAAQLIDIGFARVLC